MGVLRSAALALLVFSLSACETMDADSCHAANWYEMGVEDGANGARIDRGAQYAEECVQYGVAANVDDYEDGWRDGIRTYCTRDNGYQVGREGRHYADSCPIHLRDAFYVGYAVGRKINRAQADLDQLERQIDELRDEAAKDGLTGDQRGALRAERKNLEDDLEDANWDLSEARTEARNLGFPAY